MNKSAGYWVYLLVVSLLLALLLEFVSLKINARDGMELPFFYVKPEKLGKVEAGSQYNLLDPHLGYAYGEGGPEIDNLKERFTWIDGFVAYKKPSEKMERPVILALGGSTTDGVLYGHSWPEEFAKILTDRGIRGTVINGGTGGYSTNQELLKLIRDGLTFKPDIVISFSGVNDRGRYSELPYPMVHPHQREVLNSITQTQSSLMPNTVSLLKRSLAGNQASISYTLGVRSTLDLAGQYERNIALMNAVSKTSGADFFAFIQPNSRWKNGRENEEDKGESPIASLYSSITDIPARKDFCHDLTGIFGQHDDVYKEDGTHVTADGDRIIAEEIFKLVSDAIARKQAN